MDQGAVVPQHLPRIGEDVSALMPAVGEDVTSLMAGGDKTPAIGDDVSGLMSAESQPKDKRGLLRKGLDLAFTPIPWIAEKVESAAKIADQLGAKGINISGPLVPLRHQGTAIKAAVPQSPGDIAMTGTGPISRVASGLLATRGLSNLLDAESLTEAGTGALQTVLGAFGARAPHVPAVPTRVPLQLRAAPTVVDPAGVAVRPGAMVPDAPIAMRQTGPGAFAPDVSARRAPIVDFDAKGQPIFGGDVNAPSAVRPTRGVLPAKAESLDEFVPTPGGRVSQRRDVVNAGSLVDEAGEVAEGFASDLAAVRNQPVRGKAPAEPITRRAAVADREFDGSKVTREIFSGDPDAVDAPLVNLADADKHELRRMLAEMDNLEYTPRSFNEAPIGKGGSLEVTAGGAGARVYDDITKGYAGSKPVRADVAQGIQDALDGKHSALSQRALAAARGRQSGDPSMSRPQLPDEAGDLAQTGKQTDEDFDEFDRLVNRLAGEGTADLGQLAEAGSIDPMLAARMGSGAAGAATGYATADEDDGYGKKLLRGVVGGALGAAAPSLLRARPAGTLPIVKGVRSIGPGQAFPTTGRPAPQPLRTHADPLKGTGTFVAKFPAETQSGVREILERNGGFDAQRRGVVNSADVARLSEAITVDKARTLKPGTALNAEGIRAFSDSIATAQSKVNELAAKVNAGGTDADLLALVGARAEVQTLTASVMGARAEAGRALAEFKVLARVLEAGTPKQIRDAVDGLRGEAVKFAEEFSKLPADPIARYRWLQTQSKSTWLEKGRSVFYANILSGVKTHERNILGNVNNAISGLASHPFAVGADIARSKIKGTPRTVTMAELPAQVTGAIAGIERGFSDAVFTLRNGINRDALRGAMTAAESGKWDLPRVELPGGGANPLNYPGRALDAADVFFRAVARHQELYGAAATQAKREGLSGNAFQTRIADLVSGTDEVARELQTKADVFARRQVFQEQPGKVAASVMAVQRAFPPLVFVMPFIKTPANIMRQGLEFSPAGFGMKAARAGGREGAQALGRATAGTVGVGLLAWLASTGRLSGAAPSDAAERAQLYESGWRPNSVKIGDKWVSYSLFQPISGPASVVANAYQTWKQAGADASVVDKIGATVIDTLRSQLDNSFLSGLSDLVEALQDGGRGGNKVARAAGRIASGFVPLSGAVRTVAQAADPMVRQPETIDEQIKTGIPGMSQQVPAKLDRFGREIQREGGALRRAADPFNVSMESDDSVLAELGRLGVNMGYPSDKIEGLQLSRDQERQVHTVKGTVTYRRLEALINSARYQRLSDEQKAEALDDTTKAARTSGAKAMRLKLRPVNQ